jgi:hypothetical protein
VLLLQGGGALGSYQAGVYQALAEANLHPDWIAGVSRPADTRQAYFDGLEVLRGHLSRCLGQAIAGIRAQEKGLIAHCQGTWQLESYATEPAYSSNDTR